MSGSTGSTSIARRGRIGLLALVSAAVIAAPLGSAQASGSKVISDTCNDAVVVAVSGSGPDCFVSVVYNSWTAANCPINACRVVVTNRSVGSGLWSATAYMWYGGERRCAQSSVSSATCTYTTTLRSGHVLGGYVAGSCYTNATIVTLLMESDCEIALYRM